MPLKAFISDPDTGMSVQMIKYEAGFTNPWHRHNCAHGIYVLEGTLKTHAGIFGPGNFVWFPEGMLMEHGATEDGDVTTLFITNKPFDIRYAFEDEQGSSTGWSLGGSFVLLAPDGHTTTWPWSRQPVAAEGTAAPPLTGGRSTQRHLRSVQGASTG